ncbi:cell envelope biogenesis protein TolA, partial [Xanthomonas oryzae pv. oryzae]
MPAPPVPHSPPGTRPTHSRSIPAMTEQIPAPQPPADENSLIAE